MKNILSLLLLAIVLSFSAQAAQSAPATSAYIPVKHQTIQFENAADFSQAFSFKSVSLFSCADIEAIIWRQAYDTCMQNQDPNFPEICYWVADYHAGEALRMAGCLPNAF